MLGPSKLPPNLNYNQIANINDEEFFFCITFPKFEFDCCVCNFSLRLGVLLIGFFFILCGAASFIQASHGTSSLSYFSSLTLLAVYCFAFILLLISAFNFSYTLAYIAYLLYCLVLLFSFMEVIIVTTLMFTGKLSLAGEENEIIKAISFFLFGILLTCFFMYCVWIIFCYMIHLKYNRADLVCGIYGTSSSKNCNESNQIGSGDTNGVRII